jgi:hypothetical protein
VAAVEVGREDVKRDPFSNVLTAAPIVLIENPFVSTTV